MPLYFRLCSRLLFYLLCFSLCRLSFRLFSDLLRPASDLFDPSAGRFGAAVFSVDHYQIGSADLYFDPAEFPTNGLTTQLGVLNPTITSGTGIKPVGGSGVTLELYLGSTGGTDNNTANKFTGTCIVTGFTVNSSMDGMVEASISFQGSGACVFSLT